MDAFAAFFFKYRPVLFERGSLAFRPLLPWPWLVLLAAAGAAIAFLAYRRSAAALTPGWHYLLVACRAAPLLPLLVIAAQPVLVLHSVLPQKNFVAVAYDLSKSMEIHDGPGGQSRLSLQQSLLRPTGNTLLDDLGRKFKLRFFRFASGAERTEGFQDESRHGDLTDIGRSLDQIMAELGGVPLAGIVMLTDGADNRASDLNTTLARLKARRIPVYPVGIGLAGIPRDTELLRVSAPKKALKDALIEAEVAVKSRGYAGRQTRLIVKEGERTLHSQDIVLGGDDEVKTYKVDFSCEGAGPKILTFRVEPFRNELIQEDNDQAVLVRLEDERPKILYTEGEPRWIYAFLRRAVSSDKNLQLVTLLRQADGKFYRQGVESQATLEKGFPVDKAELFQYKALILGSVEASFFTFDQLRLISDFVTERGGGFLMLAGKNSFGQGGYSNTPLEDLLPVAIRANSEDPIAPFDQETEFKVQLTADGLTHPVTRLSPSAEENRKRWEALPPLAGFNPTGDTKPAATTLATMQVGTRAGAGPPLLAFQRYGKGKSAALTTPSIWRWRMEQEHGDNFHELFWRQLLRWLVSDVPDPVSLESEKHSYSLDESAVLRAEVRDESFLPLNDAQVRVTVKSPSGRTTTIPLSWELRKEGVYSARYKPEEQGIYEATAECYRGDRSLGASRTSFRVAESYEEYHNAALNTDLLDHLAEATGGRRYAPGDVSHLPEDISYVDLGSSRIEEKDLWDMPILYFLLVACIASEWVLRKRKGLA
jgi:uncharacterized membrane protein